MGRILHLSPPKANTCLFEHSSVGLLPEGTDLQVPEQKRIAALFRPPTALSAGCRLQSLHSEICHAMLPEAGSQTCCKLQHGQRGESWLSHDMQAMRFSGKMLPQLGC